MKKRARRGGVLVAGVGLTLLAGWIIRALLDEEGRAPHSRASSAAREQARNDSSTSRGRRNVALEVAIVPTYGVAAATDTADAAPPPGATKAPSARFLRLSAAVDAAIQTRNGHRCRLLMYNVAELGEEGWPLIERIALATFDPPGDETGEQTSRVRGELVDLFQSGRLPGLAVEALERPGARADELRRVAASGSKTLEKATAAEIARLRARLSIEEDGEVVAGIVESLRGRDALDLSALEKLLAENPNRGARLALVDAIGQLPGQDWLAALGAIAKQDRDYEVAPAARLHVLERDAPVDGVLVKETRPGGATLRVGDIVTTLDGHHASTWYLSEASRTDRAHVLALWREGATIELAAAQLDYVKGTNVRRDR
ncbi:MAG: hypothetical protein ACAI25_00955 [Planctomycetota bacterium]